MAVFQVIEHNTLQFWQASFRVDLVLVDMCFLCKDQNSFVI